MWFRINLGVISDISFVKGGSDDLWTVNGYPLQIDVNVTVKDMYPAMMMSQTYKELATNIGLLDWIDNLAGLDIQQFTPITQLKSMLFHKLRILANTKEYINTKLRDTLGAGFGRTAEFVRRWFSF